MITKRLKLRLTHTVGLALLVISQHSLAADGKFSASMGLDYSSGDYGSTQDTDVWATPISLKYKTDSWSLRVSTSWLQVTGPNNVTPDGEFIGIGSGSRRTTEQGIGDVNLSATYNLLDDRNYLMGLDVIGKVKIPTADEDKFLGTGKTDYGLNLEAFKTIGNWSPYWNVGYKWKGDPNNLDYKNVWSSSLGFDFQVNRNLSIGLGYDWQQKVTNFSQNTQEASAYLNYYLNDQNKLNFYVVTGYSDASPNWGSGLVLAHYF